MGEKVVCLRHHGSDDVNNVITRVSDDVDAVRMARIYTYDKPIHVYMRVFILSYSFLFTDFISFTRMKT